MAIKMPPKGKTAAAIEGKASDFISGAHAKHVEIKVDKQPAASADTDEEKKAVVNMRFDRRLLERVDRAARRKGITRTAYIHWVLADHLEDT